MGYGLGWMGAGADGVPQPKVRLGGAGGVPPTAASGGGKMGRATPAETRPLSVGWRGRAAGVRGAVREAVAGFVLTVASGV